MDKMFSDRILAFIPISVPLLLSLYIIGNPISTILTTFKSSTSTSSSSFVTDILSTSKSHITIQLIAYLCVGIIGYYTTSKLVPNIKQYTLRKGICGKDLGKRGTPTADIPIPEALGIVPGAVFLVCLILCLVGYATLHSSTSNSLDDSVDTKLLDVNSALLSICFMLFLGFTDDVLDWPWRYKLILPTIASLPLLCCYNGSTTIVVPKQLRPLLYNTTIRSITLFGNILQSLHIISIDPIANGTLIDLGIFYFLYMSMLAVFCTNAINIFAGINGLEAGQSYIIGCSILIYNLIEVILLLDQQGKINQDDDNNTAIKSIQNSINNHLFSIMILCTFVGTCMGLLRYNWYPASVFVGDTFCYFAGMTFAVVGILSHFSKTLLLFFIPQIINFMYSTPQLFHYVPCPRHRLPSYNPKDNLCYPSTFPCDKNQYTFLWLKNKPDDIVGINMTVLNLCLRICGPMTEKNLCITLLSFQILCCIFGFFCRYYIAKFFFDDA